MHPNRLSFKTTVEMEVEVVIDRVGLEDKIVSITPTISDAVRDHCLDYAFGVELEPDYDRKVENRV